MSKAHKIDHELQVTISRTVILTGQLMHSHGAESKLIEETTVRLGRALGLEQIEIALTARAIVLTTIVNAHCVTTTRAVADRGINMYMVCEIQRMTVMAERQLYGLQEVQKRLHRLKPFHYPPLLVAFMIGLSCASFSHLLGGDWPVFGVTFFSSFIAMLVRQYLAKTKHNILVNFAVTAFVATWIASFGSRFHWGTHPSIAMAACVLLLVPGFPLINAVLDLVKGYTNMGIARWFSASLLTLSVAAGIALAMSVSGIHGWL